MKRILTTAIFVAVATLSVTPPAQANTTVSYPDGAIAFTQLVGNNLAFIFWNTDQAVDRDIFTVHSNIFANPIQLTIMGAPGNFGGFSYWLNFLGADAFGNLVFDVFVNQGAGWFLTGQFFL